MKEMNRIRFPTGEVREFAPDKNGKWKLTKHVEALEQKGRAIQKGTLMENVPPPWKPETDGAK